MTDKQIEALSEAVRRGGLTSYGGWSTHGFRGSVLSALVRRGYLKSEYCALTHATYYEVTSAGRAAVAK